MTERFTMDDLREILVHHGGVAPSMISDDPNLDLESLGIGSMAMLAIQLDLNQRLGISLTEDDLPHLRTVGGFLAFVNRARRA